jgi:hypothetical protein
MTVDVRRGTARDRERLLRAFALAGAAALIAALADAALGTVTRTLAPFYGTSLQFLVAVLAVTVPYGELLERRSKHLRRVPAEERLGVAPRDAAWAQRTA